MGRNGHELISNVFRETILRGIFERIFSKAYCCLDSQYSFSFCALVQSKCNQNLSSKEKCHIENHTPFLEHLYSSSSSSSSCIQKFTWLWRATTTPNSAIKRQQG